MAHTGQAGRRLAPGAALLSLAIGLAACEAPVIEVGMFEEEPAAAPAEDAAVDAAVDVEADVPGDEADAPPPPPSDPGAADSVQPESETLFY